MEASPVALVGELTHAVPQVVEVRHAPIVSEPVLPAVRRERVGVVAGELVRG
jgi:hypothetical protein